MRNLPVAFSIIENMPKPSIDQEPAIAMKPRQDASRDTGPPMKREGKP